MAVPLRPLLRKRSRNNCHYLRCSAAVIAAVIPPKPKLFQLVRKFGKNERAKQRPVRTKRVGRKSAAYSATRPLPMRPGGMRFAFPPHFRQDGFTGREKRSRSRP